MFCYRRLLHISWKDRIKNSDILNRLNTKRELFGNVVKRKMTFFGHMSRNKKCSITKDIIQGKIDGKRKKGRPRLSYMENIKYWTGLAPHAAFHAAHDREA